MKWLKGGALSFTMYVSIVVSVLLLMMIMYSYYAGIESATYRLRLRTLENLTSAEQYALGAGHDMSYGQPQVWDLYGDGRDSVSVEEVPWGVFDTYRCKAFVGDYIRSSSFLTGETRDKEAGSAIYLVDDKIPLHVVGDTRIRGTAYLPEAGIKSDYINRKGYTGKQLIFGEQKQSKPELPKSGVLEKWKEFQRYINSSTQKIETSELDKVHQRFEKDTLLYIKADNMTVRDSVRGFVYIESSGEVKIRRSAYLEDVIIRANSIVIDRGFVGQGQFYAREHIEVNEEVSLLYPSVLILESDSGQIEIQKEAIIDGLVVVDGGKDNYDKRLLKVEKKAEIDGLIYCNGLMESYGIVNGHATVKRFTVRTFSGIYRNYILNAEYTDDLDSAYLSPVNWFDGKNRKAVVKFLN